MKSNRTLILSVLFATSSFVTSQALEVLPSCDKGGYSIFDETSCLPSEEKAQSKTEQPPQKQKMEEKSQPVEPYTSKQTIVEKKVRYFVDWGEYRTKSPQELLAIIRNLLNNQAPAVGKPEDAPVGCCYGKLVKPPTYEEVLIKYVAENGGVKVKTAPAQFKEVEKKILVRPAYHKIEVIPGKYKTVQEKIQIVPPRTIWTYNNGIFCKVTVPGEYVTLTRKVLVEPPKCKKVLVPAEFKVIKVKELVKDATCQKQPLPPKYAVVKKVFQVKGPEVIWDAVLCDVNLKPEGIKLVQQKLKELGYYNGPINGELNDQTMAAVVKFQVENNLPAGNISIETLEKLGLHMLAQNYLRCEIKNLK